MSRIDVIGIGSWKLSLGQSFDIDLVDCELRDTWSYIQAAGPETTVQDVADAYADWERSANDDRALQRKLLLHSMLLDIDSGDNGGQATRHEFTSSSLWELGPGNDQRSLAWVNGIMLDMLEGLDDIEEDVDE